MSFDPAPDAFAERLARLRAVLEAWGADPARWPEADRPLAEDPALMRAARAEREEAARLDALLMSLRAPAPAADAETRLAAALAEPAPGPGLIARLRGLLDAPAFAPGAGAAAALALGLALGRFAAPDAAPSPEMELMAYAEGDPITWEIAG